MGKNNRERRRHKAAKRRDQHRRRVGDPRQPRPSTSGPGEFDGAWSMAAVRRALLTLVGMSGGDASTAALELEAADLGTIVEVAEELFAMLVPATWEHGWQPVELAHARRDAPDVGRLIAVAIAADHVGRDRTTMHPRWVAQADEITAGERPRDGWLTRVVEREAQTRTFAMALFTRSLRMLGRAPRLAVLIPPPGSDRATWSDANETESKRPDDPVLVRVRALLAQAESTTFEAEAETFTAKAQELMARHAIDAARVWALSSDKARPISARLAVDDPYVDQKSLLLSFVADHSQCRAVWHDATALMTIVGFPADVAATELLFTSLLVQAQAALQAEAAAAPPGARVRGRSFRASFLHAYAHRIGARLEAVNETVRRDVERDGAAMNDDSARSSLLPVLAARREAVDAEVDDLFGELRSSRCASRVTASVGFAATGRPSVHS